jgi:hypothetical protein
MKQLLPDIIYEISVWILLLAMVVFLIAATFLMIYVALGRNVCTAQMVMPL